MFRSLLLTGVLSLCAGGSLVLGTDPLPPGQLPDTTPPGKPHFDSKGAKAGDQLPNLPMHGLDGKQTSLGQAWKGGTTLLLTSSYTCPKSRATYPGAAELARRMSGSGVHVAIVYIIEAHPAGNPSPYTGTEDVTADNRRDHILCRQPSTLEERVKLANEFAGRMKIGIPVFVDAMDNAAWTTLGGGPNMGVLVDGEGIVLARQGWFDAKSMETAIGAIVAALPKVPAATQPDEAARNISYTLYQLIASNKVNELKMLLDQQPEWERGILATGESLLQEAASQGHVDVVKLLVARGADVNRQSAVSATPLHLAAARGHANVVRFLLEHGADVNAKTQGHGPTPLQETLLSKNTDIAETLIKAGARPNFFTAAATGDLAALRRDFLQDMTILSRPDGRGRSALVYAAATGHLDSAKLLISLGARDFPGDAYDRRSVWWAAKASNLEMTSLLLDAGSNPDLFHFAIDDEAPIEFVRTLLAHKADPNADHQIRPLHMAAGYGRPDIMQVLLDAGADINGLATQSNGLMCGLSYHKGDTPLHVAIENRQPKASEFLLKHGAKMNLRNADGKTALHFAISELNYHPEEAEQMARLLVEQHADVNVKDNEGLTPLDYAVPHNNGGIFEGDKDRAASFAPTIELLKKHGAVKGKPGDAKVEK